MFSASAISKLLTTPAQYNSIIYEKCARYALTDQPSGRVDGPGPTGPREATGPLTWGIKYEPLSAMLYEYMNDRTTLRTTYGCIPHPKYSFIGASPDGIVVNPESAKYGRLVEIKNIWNREITGDPKVEYYVQMQFQMDVCGLDVCEFEEVHVKEYSGSTEFFADTRFDELDFCGKGVVLYFSRIEPEYSACMFDNDDDDCLEGAGDEEAGDGMARRSGERTITLPASSTHPTVQTSKDTQPPPSKDKLDEKTDYFYDYMPLNTPPTPESVDNYIVAQRELHRDTHQLCHISYWYLEVLSCVQVDHNPLWIEAVIPIIKTAWDTVERERISGEWVKRAPKSRSTTGAGMLAPNTTLTVNKIAACMFNQEEGDYVDEEVK